MLNSVTAGCIVNALIFSVLGIIILSLAIIVIDDRAPRKTKKEIFEEHNTALAIIVAGVILGIAYIIGSAIHG